MELLNYSENLYRELETELETTNLEKQPVKRAGRALEVSLAYLKTLKDWVKANPPADQEQEILLFKQVKPRFKSWVIFYQQLLNLESRKIGCGSEGEKAFYRHELEALAHVFEANLSFYQYVRTESDYLDSSYYVRGAYDLKLHPDDASVDGDEFFMTSHDNTLARLFAAERLQEYLQQAIRKTDMQDPENFLPFDRHHWTASQTDAIELIYALKASGSVNNGNIDIAQLVQIFEYAFTIELKDYYHKYTDITRRKKDIPVFLYKLRDGLLRWIDDKMGL